MLALKKVLTTTVAKKFLMALSGLLLIGFTITHLLGNLALYLPEGSAFNKYAHTLHELGWLLYAAEIALAALFFVHIFSGLMLKQNHSDARPINYSHSLKSKGGPTKHGFGSKTMIISGVTIMFFLFFHVWQFKYGPWYETTVNGIVMRDLHRLVVEVFKQPLFVGIYVVVMILLGLHLRHGFWSAFQSLGVSNSNLSKAIYSAALVFSFVLAAGFLFIPIYIYFA